MQSPPASPTKSSASPTKGEFVYKIILIGSAAVGKTNLLSVAARGEQFNERSEATLQPEFVTVKVQRPDWKFGEANQFIRAQVWDTAGQERYQAISSSHYRRANGALIVYDVSEKETFKQIFPGHGAQWLSALKQNADPSLLAAVMLVENKVDKLKGKTLERPGEKFVQSEDVTKALNETVFKDPKKGLGWLYDAKPSETVPFRIANSLMFARTSAVTSQCQLFELTDKTTQDLISTVRGVPQKPLLEYEPSLEVKTISQALEALILRIYARSKDIEAGGIKRSGKTFRIHETQEAVADTTNSNPCC